MGIFRYDLSNSPENLKKDTQTFLAFYQWIFSHGDSEDQLPKDLGDEIYLALARIDRFKFRRIGVPNLRLFEKAMMEGFEEDSRDDTALAEQIALGNNWSFVAALNYLTLHPPFIRPEVSIPAPVERYYGIAATHYIHDFHEGCIAFCRVTLEGIIKKRTGMSLEDKFIMSERLQAMREMKILDEESFQYASEVVRSANKVLHRMRPASGKEAEKALKDLRYFVESFYGYENLKKARGGREIKTK